VVPDRGALMAKDRDRGQTLVQGNARFCCGNCFGTAKAVLLFLWQTHDSTMVVGSICLRLRFAMPCPWGGNQGHPPCSLSGRGG
jgi:hypothetical protein